MKNTIGFTSHDMFISRQDDYLMKGVPFYTQVFIRVKSGRAIYLITILQTEDLN